MTSERNERERLGVDRLEERAEDGGHLESGHLESSPPNEAGAGHPDDEYLLTAYLFGDISPAGKEDVERRLAESDAMRAELERLRSTKLLIEDALKGPLEDGNEEESQGRKVDPQELGALLRERRRARRVKTVISWISVAATLVICGTLFVPTLSRGRLDTRAMMPSSEVAGGGALGDRATDDLAYAPSAQPESGDAARGGTYSPHFATEGLEAPHYFAGKAAGGAVSADSTDERSRSDSSLYAYGTDKKADGDHDGAYAERLKDGGLKLESMFGRRIEAVETPQPATELGAVAEPTATTGQARTQEWKFAPGEEVTRFDAPQVATPAKRASESARQRGTGARGPEVGQRSASKAAPAPPARPSEPAKPASRRPGVLNAPDTPEHDGFALTLPARQRIDQLEKNEAAGDDPLFTFSKRKESEAIVEEDGDRYGEQRRAGELQLEGLNMSGQLDEEAPSEEALRRLSDVELGASQAPDERWRRGELAQRQEPQSPAAQDRLAQNGQQEQGQKQQAGQAGAGRNWSASRKGIEQRDFPAPNLALDAPGAAGVLAGEADELFDQVPDVEKARQAEGESRDLRLQIEHQLRELAASPSSAERFGASGTSSRSSSQSRGDGARTTASNGPPSNLGAIVGELPPPEDRTANAWFDDAKPDATAPEAAGTQVAGGFASGERQLQQQIKNFARRAGRTQSLGGAVAGDAGQIVPDRAREIADLVNSQQARLFERERDPDVDSPVVNAVRLNRDFGALGIADLEGTRGWLARLDAGYHNAQREIAPLEKEFRAYTYYRSLDGELTFETYSAQPLDVPPPAIGDENLGRDGFRSRYGVNPFVDTRHDHFSTFSMDVDTASFTRARERIRSGQLPDPAAVRVEEFVNYFPQDCAPDPQAAFSVCTEGGPAPFGKGLDLLKITVKARELRPNERKGAVLTFAIDTSGSMHLEDSLNLMRDALKALVESLRPDDQVAVIAYNANAYVVLPHTPAREKERIFAALASLNASGGTNVQGGLDLAYRLADEVRQPKAVNRVVLCSDGVANVGARDPKEVLEKVKVFAARGIYLSVVGFGTRRYNDSFLETLAGQGNGNYTYVANLAEARSVFQKNLPATLHVLAEDAKIQLDFNPDVVAHYRLLGYENRDIADKDFRNDKIDAAEVGPGTTVTVFYEMHRRPGSHGDLGRLFIRYRDTGTRRVDELDFNLPPGVLETKLESTSPEFRFTACAAEAAELLRDSYWARDGSFGRVLETLYGLEESFRARPEWSELAQLVTEAQRLLVIRVASSVTNE